MCFYNCVDTTPPIRSKLPWWINPFFTKKHLFTQDVENVLNHELVACAASHPQFTGRAIRWRLNVFWSQLLQWPWSPTRVVIIIFWVLPNPCKATTWANIVTFNFHRMKAGRIKKCNKNVGCQQMLTSLVAFWQITILERVWYWYILRWYFKICNMPHYAKSTFVNNFNFLFIGISNLLHQFNYLFILFKNL